MNQQPKKANRLPGGAIKLRQTVGLQSLERVGSDALMEQSYILMKSHCLSKISGISYLSN
jgi:hypothetical protein